jgi:hypothetical protein
MRTALIAFASLASVAAAGLGLRAYVGGNANGNFKVMHVDELAKLVAAKDPSLAIYDANPNDYRAAEGIIPGAKLLSSFNRYDVAKELPAAKDSKLVFYCASTR